MSEMERVSRGFRRAYVVKKGPFNFRTLEPFCEEIVYMTGEGAEHVDDTRDRIYLTLKNFDPKQDVIVPTGSSTVNMIAGTVIREILAEEGSNAYYMGVYQSNSYQFWRVSIAPVEESYEVT